LTPAHENLVAVVAREADKADAAPQGDGEDVDSPVRLDDLIKEFVFRAAHAEAIHLFAGGHEVEAGSEGLAKLRPRDWTQKFAP